MTSSTGALPQSNALAEASPESLLDLLSRDPEGYQQKDRERVYAELRAQRARFEKAEGEGKKAKSDKLSAKALLQQKPQDIGL